MPNRFFFNSNDGISPKKVRSLKKKYGPDILIGVDPGNGDIPDSDARKTLLTALNEKLAVHIYLVGFGMMSWSKEEAQQIQHHARSVGIDTKQTNWHKKWKNGGWEIKAKQQFDFYWSSFKAYSCEIDNLDGIWDQNPQSNLLFYHKFADYLKKNNIRTRLMIKNLNTKQLSLVVNDVKNGKLRRSFLADWGMFEEGTGNISNQIKLCNEMGIVAVTPKTGITETHSYGVVPEGIKGPKKSTKTPQFKYSSRPKIKIDVNDEDATPERI